MFQAVILQAVGLRETRVSCLYFTNFAPRFKKNVFVFHNRTGVHRGWKKF